MVDTPPEPVFDDIVALASEICEAPIALVSFVDEDRQWFKAEFGLGQRETPRVVSVCAHAILQPDLFVVPDTTQDARFVDNPLVTGPLGLRFYAGARLDDPSGLPLGTLCVLDRKPRPDGLTERQVRMLSALARQVMTELNLRRAIADRDEQVLRARSSEQRLREKEEEASKTAALLQAIDDSSHNPLYAKDLNLRFIYANPAMLSVLGQPKEKVLGRRIEEIILRPEQAKGFNAHNQAVIESNAPVQVIENFTTPDGGKVTFQTSLAPLRGPGGRTTGIVGVSSDITARQQVVNELNETLERLKLATEGTGIATYDLDLATGEGTWSKEAFELLGLSPPEDLRGSFKAWRGSIHPEDLPRILSEHEEHARRGGAWRTEYRIIRQDTGETRWLMAYGQFVIGSGGTVRSTGITADISERKRAEERQRLLLNELNHRVKNTLAVVQSLAQQSFKGSEVAAKPRRAFEERLAALAAAHNLLTDQCWEFGSLVQVIERAVAPYRGNGRGFSLHGEDLNLSPQVTVSLSLALHELATNAVKYGALSAPGGQVRILWSVKNGRLNLQWLEVGGPVVRAPSKRGFGTRMIERGLASELGGTVSIDFRPEGLICTLDAPVPEPGVQPLSLSPSPT